MKKKPAKKKSARKFRKITAKRIDERISAIDIAEKARSEAAKSGGKHKYHVGSTAWITPTKQGLSRLTRIIKGISQRKITRRDVYSFDMHFTFTDKHGKPVNKNLANVGIPNIANIKRMPGESRHSALNRWVRRKITRQIFEAFAEHFPYPKTVSKLKRAGMSEAKANATIRKIKEQRNAKLSITIYRDTP